LYKTKRKNKMILGDFYYLAFLNVIFFFFRWPSNSFRWGAFFLSVVLLSWLGFWLFSGEKIHFVCLFFFSMEKFSEMCCLQFLLHVCVDFTRLYLWFSWFFFCSVLYFCFVFFVYCDIFGLLWRGLVFRLVSKWRTYWKHGVNFWTQKTNAKK
jgi:hypothetical protein